MKKWNKTAILLFTISCIILLQSSYTVTTAKANNDNNSDKIVTYADGIEWRYKLINGKLYKRQYNHTTQKWIGSWIPV